MPYRPRELVIRAREAASILLATLDRQELVQRFVDMYAAEFRRPGRAEHPALYQDQLQTIRREAILAMVLQLEKALPAKLKIGVTIRSAKKPAKKAAKGAKNKKRALKKAKSKPAATLELAIPFLDLFREEFFTALGQRLEWTQQDAEEFWHDLELYEKLTQKQPPRVSRGSAAPAYGPFADRVAMLLDPSLMEQARRAASRFQGELNASADRLLRRTFSKSAL
jgi:hypothetical protein